MGTGLLRCELLSPAFTVIADAEQPPRRASAKPEPRHVTCFPEGMFVPRVVPGPGRRGPGNKTRGMKLPLVAAWVRAVSVLALCGFFVSAPRTKSGS
jgi:hypothetical protein